MNLLSERIISLFLESPGEGLTAAQVIDALGERGNAEVIIILLAELSRLKYGQLTRCRMGANCGYLYRLRNAHSAGEKPAAERPPARAPLPKDQRDEPERPFTTIEHMSAASIAANQALRAYLDEIDDPLLDSLLDCVDITKEAIASYHSSTPEQEHSHG